MRNVFYFLTIVLLMLPLPVFSGGGKEAEGKKQEVAAAEKATGLKVYATLSEYEKATGKKIKTFNEAPVLKGKVAAGELPPVEERLPEEPMVVQPLQEIGLYGGTLRLPARGPLSGGLDVETTRIQELAVFSPDLQSVVPNVAKGLELSDDYKTLTIFLRKGMKWSDGEPFTADDVLFWYKDILLNDQLFPSKPKEWAPGGELPKVERLNDYAVRFQFAKPNPTIISALAVARGDAFAPKHYLKKYHIKYNPKANELAKKEGYEQWWIGFKFHNERGARLQDPNLPVVDPWVLSRIDSQGNRYYDRNPYFWKVDVAGNQLPYIDTQARILVENVQVLELKVIAGEFDVMVHGSPTYMKDYTLFKEGEEKGNYRTLVRNAPRGNAQVFGLNLTHKDPILREIFNDLRFRQAFSLAIDRDELNELFYFGKATPRQATVVPWASFYEDWMGKYYAGHDLEKANKLLDEMGLKWDKNHKYRLRPDGKVLAITLEAQKKLVKINEVISDHLKKVGIKAAVQSRSTPLLRRKFSKNEADLGMWSMAQTTELAMQRSLYWIIPPWQLWVGLSCVPWGNWLESNGKSGEEPPEIIKKLYKLAQEWHATLAGTKRYLELGKEIQTIMVKNLFLIGTVGMVPSLWTVKNNVGNVAEDVMYVSDYGFWRPYQATTWFFKK